MIKLDNSITVIVLILTVILTQSCESKSDDLSIFKNDNSISPDTVAFENYQQHIQLSDVILGARFIPLESKPGSLIGLIEKVKYVDGRFYVLDVKIANTLFVFDTKGKLIYQIEDIGYGPGEFTKPYDFEVTKKDVLILDYNTRKVLKYNHSGEFQSESKLSFFANSFASIDSTGTQLAFYNRINMVDNSLEFNTLRILDSSLNVIKEGLKIDPIRSQLTLGTPSAFGSKNGKETLFAPHYSDLLFSISPTTITPEYYIDFGTAHIPNSFWEQNSLRPNELDKHLADKGYAYGVNNPIETKTHLLFSFYKDRQVNYAIFDKRNKSVQSGFMVDDDVFQMLLDFRIYCSFEDKVVALINLPSLYQRVDDAKSLMTENQFKEYQSKFSFLFDFLSSHNRDDNPVLVIIHLK